MKLKKIGIISIVFIILIFCFASYSFAEEESTFWSDVGDGLLNGFVGILTLIPRYAALIVFEGINWLITEIANSLGGNDIKMLTPDLILSNQVAITNIDFFSALKGGELGAIQKNVAGWYITLRNVAVACSACTLVYMAIRMALSTTAVEKATYKTYLTSWLISFILIFTLQFIIVGVIELNNQVAGMLEIKGTMDESVRNINISGGGISGFIKQIFAIDTFENDGGFYDLMEVMKTDAWKPFNANGTSVASTIAYCGIIFMTGVFMYLYLYRMVVVAFLIIISPIVTITYAIDKGNGKSSQSLNKWLKEFIFSVIIQPIHILLYLMLIPMSLEVIGENPIVGCILMVFVLGFIWKAEGIMKKIFGGSDSLKSGEDASKSMRPLYTTPSKYMGKGLGHVAKGAGALVLGIPSGNRRRRNTSNAEDDEMQENSNNTNLPINQSNTSNTNAAILSAAKESGEKAGQEAAKNELNSNQNSNLDKEISDAIKQAATEAGKTAGEEAGKIAGAEAGKVAGAEAAALSSTKTKNVNKPQNEIKKLKYRTRVSNAYTKLSRFKGPGISEMIAKAATGQPAKVADAEKMAKVAGANLMTAGKLTADAVATIGRMKRENQGLKAKNREMERKVDESSKTVAAVQKEQNRRASSNSSQTSKTNVNAEVESAMRRYASKIPKTNAEAEVERAVRRHMSRTPKTDVEAEVERAVKRHTSQTPKTNMGGTNNINGNNNNPKK